MTRHTKKHLQKPNEPDSSGLDVRRRRLLRAGVTSSLLLTIASRPAWAQGGMCTASALASANASGGYDFDGCSISAGWWKIKQDLWPISHSTPFHSIFETVSYNGTILYNGLTLGQVCVLNGAGNDNPGNLGMHLIGALMNALTFPPDEGTPGYAFTSQQIIDAYNALHGSDITGFQALKNTLEIANNQYDSNTDKPDW